MNKQSFFTNFPLILFILMMVTGIIWCYDWFCLRKQRRRAADIALAKFNAREEKPRTAGQDVTLSEQQQREQIEEKAMRAPLWMEYSGSFFPVIATVFFLRSFLYEPFKIPSTSMVPTLEVGDLILVNKFTYGIRLPIINKKIIEINHPKRGDVMVFKYPQDTSLDYIKRVVGVPGDRIVYRDKHLTINGQALDYSALPDYLNQDTLHYSKQYEENLSGVGHKIAVMEYVPAVNLSGVMDYRDRDACAYHAWGFSCTVPPGKYFMMGDNRDNSEDSRYWGFVSDKEIVGKAFLIWMNLGNFKRIGVFFK